MATTGHESEAINVQGLKASLQKLKTDYIDGKAEEATTLAGYGITDAYTKTEVNGLVDTPHQNYVTVAATSQTTDVTTVLPASGQAADTIYRVSNWDGSANSGAGAFDVSCYSEYAWDDASTPNKYVFLCVKSQIGEVFDISVYNNNAKYANLTAALGVDGANVPSTLRKGGMSVKFVHSVDNKYVQFRYMGTSTANADFKNVANWQGVDAKPVLYSRNLTESGGIAKEIFDIDNAQNKEEHCIPLEPGSIDNSGVDDNTTPNVLRCEPYIGISSAPTIVVDKSGTSQTVGYRYYDIGKAFLGTTYSSDAKYVRFIVLSNAADDIPEITITFNDVTYTAMPYMKVASDQAVKRLQEYVGVDFTVNQYINGSGGFVNGNDWKRTDFIQVSEGDIFYYKGRMGTSFICVGGYSGKNTSSFVAPLLSGGTYNSYTKIVIPSGVSYIVSCSALDVSYFLISANFLEEYRYDKINTFNNMVSKEFGLNKPFARLIRNDGSLSPNHEGQCTDFVPVSVGDIFYYAGSLSSNLIAVAGYSDKDDSSFQSSLLAGGEYLDNIQQIIIPSGVNYIVACGRSAYPMTLSPYDLWGRVRKLQILEKDDKSKVEKDFGIPFPNQGYILVNGAFSDVDANYRRTNFIPVSEGEKYYFMGGIGSVALCVGGYSSNDVSDFDSILLSASTYNSLQEITIPQGVHYICACSMVSDTYFLFGSSDILLYIQDRDTGTLKNEYYGKKINWLGDSIVADEDFDEIVSRYFGMTENDYGINGSTIAKDADDTRNSMAVRYVNMDNSADVIVVSGGTNDYQYSWTPFGQLGDNTVSTFYGALDVLCRGLITKYPTKIIFFTTPIKRNQDNNDGSPTTYPLDTRQDAQNSLGKYLKDYADAIKEVCAKYSIPVLDLYSESMLNPNMTAQSVYFDNVGTHPNTIGRTIMARRVKGFMKQLC